MQHVAGRHKPEERGKGAIRMEQCDNRMQMVSWGWRDDEARWDNMDAVASMQQCSSGGADAPGRLQWHGCGGRNLRVNLRSTRCSARARHEQ
jgi:hypothetical protein